MDKRMWLTALGRLAMAMQTKGRIRLDLLPKLLANPKKFSDGTFAWSQAHQIFQDSDYCNKKFDDPKFAGELLRSGLFRQTGDDLGFIHDSFIGYFIGAVVLRDYNRPDDPGPEAGMDESWLDATSELFWHDPDRWRLAAEFLAGALFPGNTSAKSETARALAKRLILRSALTSQMPASGIPQIVLAIGRGAARDPVLFQVQQAIVDHDRYVIKEPASLLQEVYNRLRWRDGIPEAHEFANGLLKDSRKQKCRSWIRKARAPFVADVQTMERHFEPIKALAVSADGQIIVSGSADKTVILWNPANDGEVKLVGTHDAMVSAVAVLEDGRIVSGSADRTVRLWNPSDKESTKGEIILIHTSSVTAIAALQDGRIVSWSENAEVKVWHPTRGRDATDNNPYEDVTEKLRDNVLAVFVRKDGTVIWGNKDGEIKRWNPSSYDEVHKLYEFLHPITAVGALNDGRHVVVASEDGKVRICCTEECSEDTIYSGLPSGAAVAVAVQNGSDWCIVWGGKDNTVKRCSKGFETQVIGRHSEPITALIVLGDGRVVSGSADAKVKLWNRSDSQNGARIANSQAREILRVESPHTFTSVAVMEDGCVVAGSSDWKVTLWNPANGNKKQMDAHKGKINALAVLRDGRVISGGEDKKVILWDPKSENPPQQIGEKHPGAVTALAVLGDRLVVVGTRDPLDAVTVWDYLSGRRIRTMGKYVGWVRTLSVMENRFVIAGCTNNSVWKWDLKDGSASKIADESNSVNAVAVLKDCCIVTGSDKTVNLWRKEIDGWALPREIIRHEKPITALAALDDQRIVSGSYDRTVKLWDPVEAMSSVTLPYFISGIATFPQTPHLAVACGNCVKVLAIEPLNSTPSDRFPSKLEL